MLSIRVVTHLEEFARLAERWNRLLAESPSNTVFLTWEWLYTWANHYLGNSTLFILLACEDDHIIGIAPFYIRRTSTYHLLHLRQVEFLGTGEACSSYLDIIVEGKNRSQVVRTIYNYLHGEAKRLWDVHCLTDVPAESSSIDLLYEMVNEDGKVIEIVNHTCCPVIKLTGSEEDFLKGISGNERYNLRRKEKRLEKLGHVDYSRASSTGDVQKGMDTFVELHGMRWRQKDAGGSFKSQTFLRFHKDVSELFGRKGWVHLDFLSLNGEKVAGVYGYSYNGKYYFYLPGLNPEIYPETSPGRLLLFQCVRHAIRDGCTEFDLLRGPADYKMAWANGLRRSVTLRHYNNTIRASASKLIESAKGIVKVLVR